APEYWRSRISVVRLAAGGVAEEKRLAIAEALVDEAKDRSGTERAAGIAALLSEKSATPSELFDFATPKARTPRIDLDDEEIVSPWSALGSDPRDELRVLTPPAWFDAAADQFERAAAEAPAPAALRGAAWTFALKAAIGWSRRGRLERARASLARADRN